MYGVKEHSEPFRYYVSGQPGRNCLVVGVAEAGARMSKQEAIHLAYEMRLHGWDVSAFQWT